jgi:hypothetical protein
MLVTLTKCCFAKPSMRGRSLVGREDEDFSPNGGLLRSADSLGVTRMRLEKQRQRTLLAEIASMDGIEDVITENVRQSATLILKVRVPPRVKSFHLRNEETVWETI